MPIKNFHIAPFGHIIAASIAWSDPVVSVEAASPEFKPLKLAGTGARLPLGFLTKSGDNFVAGDFARGMPDHEVSKVVFFIPFFACLTPGAGGEVKGTSTITTLGMATRAPDGQRTPGTIEVLSTIDSGQWIEFTPAQPIPGGVTQVFTLHQNISDGTYPRLRPNGPQKVSIWGGIVPDERSSGSDTSLESTLSDSTTYGNGRGAIVSPSHMLVETPESTKVTLAIGDSQEYGADMTASTSFFTNRLAFAWLEMGLDDNKLGQRIQHGNFFVSGWGYTTADAPGQHGNANSSARQLSILTSAVALNGGRAVADNIQSGHGTNSATGQVSDALNGLRSMFSIFKAAAGMPTDAPVTQWEMDAYPESSDGYNSLAGQKPQGSPTTQANVYPGGTRWGINEAIGGSGTTIDTNATLYADGTITSSGKLWPISSFDTGDNRDVFSLLTSYGLAQNYSGGNVLSLTNEPIEYPYIAVHQGGTTYYAHVLSFTGSGPYSTTVIWPQGEPGSLATGGTTVRGTWSGGGLHGGAYGHGRYAFDETYGVAAWKQSNGLGIPLAAPALSNASYTGTVQDGEEVAISYTLTGNPAPTVSIQPMVDGVDAGAAFAGGQSSATYTINQTALGISENGNLRFEIAATNSEGSDVIETPDRVFTVPVIAPKPVLVDSVSGIDATNDGTATATGLTTSGADNKIIAGVTAGTSDSVNDITVTVTGDGAAATMTRVFFTGTTTADPASSFEATAGFVIDEADIPGNGPYTVEATATGSNVPDKVGLVAGSVSGAVGGVQTFFERSNSVTVPGGTAITPNTFTFAVLSSAQADSNATMTGATQIENAWQFGDTIQLGWTGADPTGLTVTGSETTRPVSALILIAPN